MPQRIRKREDLKHCGQRWVDENYDLKKELKDANGGKMPPTPAFSTSNFQGSDQWSEQDLPDILFYLQPPMPDSEVRETQPFLNKAGHKVKKPGNEEHEPRKIPTLPDRIAIDVPAWMVMAWRRLDPQITLQDIIDRMTTDLGEAQKLTEKTPTIPNRNCLQNSCTRNCRKVLRYYNGYGRRAEPHRAEVEAMETLTMNNIRYNTILEYHPTFHRLIKVRLTRDSEGGRFGLQKMDVTEDNMLETTYPVDYFLFDGYNCDPSDNMDEAVTMLWTLQERALRHGMGPSDWKKLNKTCLPSTWFDRTKKSVGSDEPLAESCQICVSTFEEADGVECTPDEGKALDLEQNDRNKLRHKGSVCLEDEVMAPQISSTDDQDMRKLSHVRKVGDKSQQKKPNSRKKVAPNKVTKRSKVINRNRICPKLTTAISESAGLALKEKEGQVSDSNDDIVQQTHDHDPILNGAEDVQQSPDELPDLSVHREVSRMDDMIAYPEQRTSYEVSQRTGSDAEAEFQAVLDAIMSEAGFNSESTEPDSYALPESSQSDHRFNPSSDDDPMLFSDMVDPLSYESSFASTSDYSQQWATGLDRYLPLAAPPVGVG